MRISVTLRKKKISEEVIEKVIEIGELIDVNHQKASLFGIVVGTIESEKPIEEVIKNIKLLKEVENVEATK